MIEHTKVGYWSACIVAGIVFFIACKKYHAEVGASLLICYVATLLVFAGFMGIGKRREKWSGMDIVAVIFGSALALWVPVVLIMVL